jgi:hypothetical protein
LIIASLALFMGAIFLYITINIHWISGPVWRHVNVSALFIPFASPNVLSTVYDVSLPKCVQRLTRWKHSLKTPALRLPAHLRHHRRRHFAAGRHPAGLYQHLDLCFIFLLFAIRFIPKDIRSLHEVLRARPPRLRQLQPIPPE